jgi:excisionase family DNA binding protein
MTEAALSTVIPLDRAARSRRSSRPSNAPSEVLTVAETAAYLRLSLNTTYAYLADGTIPGERVGRRWIILRARLDAWLSGSREVGR